MKLFYEWLILAIWIVWIGYWWIAAWKAKPVERRESPLARASHIVPLIVAVLIFNTPARWYGPLADVFFARGYLSYWTGVAVLLAGLGLAIYARRSLGGNWSGTVTVKIGHELVRGGPYRWVRHPIYTGLLMGFLGCAIALGEWRGLVAVAIVAASLYFKLRREERWMTRRFGDVYSSYRREVRALIPFLL